MVEFIKSHMIQLNPTYFLWNLVKFSDFGGLGGGNGAFTRSSSNTKRSLRILGAFLAQIGDFHLIPLILGEFQ